MNDKTNKSEKLEEVLRKYRPELNEEYKTLLSKELSKIESTGTQIYETLKQISEEEKVLYLGSLVEAEHIRQHLSYLASHPKAVSPVHEARAKRP